MSGRRPADVPTATYRVQLGPDLSFDDVAGIADHLARLGITHVYASPVLEPVPGATHGYHIVDPHRVNAELGGREGLERLSETLSSQGSRLILDIVPNHLAAHPANPWWWDVLARGPDSAHARAFDIDWASGGGRLVLPTLGGPRDECIAAGELRLVEEDGEPLVAYHDARYPLARSTHDRALELLRADEGPSHEDLTALLDEQHHHLTYWRTGISELNYRRFFDITDLVGVRVEDREVFDVRHALILELIRDGVVDALRIDHVDGLRDPDGYLEDLREASDEAAGEPVYVVVEKIVEGDEPLPEGWPVAGTTGYELASAATAVQVDLDGLAALDRHYRAFTGIEGSAADILHERKRRALDELLHPEVDGLVRRAADLLAELEPPDQDGAHRESGTEPHTAAAAGDAPDPGTLDPVVLRAAPGPGPLRAALVAVTAAFPVYRTYIRTYSRGGGDLRREDREHLTAAFAGARDRHPDLDPAAIDAWERLLTLDLPPGATEDLGGAWLDLVLRWQQLTGPAMAKGFEDTTFYVMNRLVALNEVGADADGLDHPHGVDGFHARIARRAEAWPHAMNTTSTHDTKRSEDVRARIAVLSEIPERWAETVARWHDATTHLRSEVAGHPAPDRNEEWLLYQTLVGMWPLDEPEEGGVADRLAEYAVKAAREAKVNTDWLDPGVSHEESLRRFVHGLVADEAIVSELRDLLREVALPGVCNSLAQLTWRLLAPGVPDTYQGTELWDWSLVDPDNRRPVDHVLRRHLLDEVIDLHGRDPLVAARELRDTWGDGRLKLLVLWRLLRLRRDREELLRDGGYLPLRSHGEHAGRVVAFARTRIDAQTRAGGWVAAITPRHVLGLAPAGDWPTGDVWGATEVEVPVPADGPPGDAPAGDGSSGRTAVDVLTGREVAVVDGRVRLADALSRLPVAVLVTTDSGG